MTGINFYWPAGKACAIMVAENAIDKEVCDLALSELKKHYDKMAHPGPTVGGMMPSIKNSMDINWSHHTLVENNLPTEKLDTCENVIVEKLFLCIAKYIEQFKWLWDWTSIQDTGFRVQEYKKGIGYYREHIDGGLDSTEATRDRILAAIIYLNDVEIGGETYFREHDVKVPAKVGSICLFPTHWAYPHQGLLPVSNDKWIISTFIQTIYNSNNISNNSEDGKEIIISSTQMPKENE